jgi:transposase
MFIRKKKNKSGVISIQVIDKSAGKYKLLKTIGSSSVKSEIDKLYKQGQDWIKDFMLQSEIDFFNEDKQINQILENIEQIDIIGTELLLCKLYEEIGFSHLNEPLLRKLVFSRLCFPVSKLKTSDYLMKYHSEEISVDKIYRYMDKLIGLQKDQIHQISYQHTLQILSNKISILFYDVTTLYFEIDDEDELRKTGFSKEGKHQNPQIVLGLLVSIDGYPLAYEIFEGNKFEGHTMLPVVDSFKAKYKLDNLVIIADSGLMSNDNVKQLMGKEYSFILGARIRNETEKIKSKILQLQLKNGCSAIIKKDNKTRLIISYSESRAKKDKANREKGIKKLEKQIKTGKLNKSSINNRGYNKFLKLEGETKVSINKIAIENEYKWDGLKGYITNTNIKKEEIIENYGHLWKIEKAFRISKTDLKIRPIYHRLKHRIEAHICISFMAYKIYKELERQLKLKKSILSPEKAIEIAKTIYSIKIISPIKKEIIKKTLILNQEQKYLMNLFQLN